MKLLKHEQVQWVYVYELKDYDWAGADIEVVTQITDSNL